MRDAIEAEALLAAAAASGMERAVWARSHGIDPRSLNAWRLNLCRGQRAPELRLVELVPSGLALGEPERLVVRCGPFAVEVGERFDDETLRRVLVAVASC